MGIKDQRLMAQACCNITCGERRLIMSMIDIRRFAHQQQGAREEHVQCLEKKPVFEARRHKPAWPDDMFHPHTPVSQGTHKGYPYHGRMGIGASMVLPVG